MANVSSSNGLEKRPKLRFPGFDEPWNESKLLACFAKNIKKNTDGRISNVICNSAKMGLIPQRDYFDKDIANSDNTSGYYIIEHNDFVYNPRKSSDAPYGPISRYAYPDAGIVSPLYLCFRAKGDVDTNFFEWYFRSSAWHRYIYMTGDSGARHDRVSIKDDDFFSMPIRFPSSIEQKKIASFLNAIERRISSQQLLVDNLKKYKRGLSDELFGEKESGQRWMTVPFSEAFDLLQNNTFSRDEMSTENGIAYNIHYGDVLIKYGAVVNLSTSKVPYIRSDVSLSKYAQSSYLRDGDIVIADTAEDYTVGKAVEIVGVADAKALSGLHTIPCRPKISFAPMYLGYFINSKRFRTQILPLVQGTKVSSISKSEILKTSIAFPSFGVQSQIASMLYALDHRIDICQACVQGLVRTKEALLQQLFI